MFMAWTFGSFEVKESAQDISIILHTGLKIFFPQSYSTMDIFKLEQLFSSYFVVPILSTGVFLCPILLWFGVEEGQREDRNESKLDWFTRPDEHPVGRVFFCNGAVCLWSLCTEFTPSFSSSSKFEGLDIFGVANSRMPPPCPLGESFLSRSIGAWIDSESHACISRQ